MDQTQEYITMCAKAVEIQKSIEYKKASGENNILITDTGDWIYWKRYFEGVKSEIWLPRQDQLQGMVENCETRIEIQIIPPRLQNKFGYKYQLNCNSGVQYPDGFLQSNSMEQLWLAFVMSELYQKRWDSEKEDWSE